MSDIRTVVVDDEYFNRELIKLLVSRASPDIIISGEAGNLKEAVILINAVDPDVVFLDIKMPDGSGFDLLKRFPNQRFKAIFVTGFDDFVIKAIEAKAFDYILKPIDTDKFQSTVEKVRLQVLDDREKKQPAR